ncbi:AAA family ATPase [Pseudooceanicola nanhaiensis]|uniref:AAA family ATPase n=1 Tax=Pseudooceanicola nanhaiensis TaxID=375761 RepID=UPI003514E6FA
MKLRALTLENVRKFGGKRVSIDALGDGITVICEANEFGKSTFFDAIHAVVFEKHGASGKSIKSLQPHAGGGIRIGVEVEIDGARYAVEKRFLSQKGASVTDMARGTVIARDGEAEDWIARHIGAPEQGPAGLLWVRQGVLGLEPTDGTKTERERLAEARRDLLSSVAGEIEQVTGGRTMDRILRRCQGDLDALATGSRLSPKGAWKDAVDAVKSLGAELDVLERQCTDLSDALNERRAAEGELRRLDDPEARTRRETDLRQAREAASAAESHAQKVASAKGEVDLAAMRRNEAQRARDDFATAIEAAESSAKTLAGAEQLHRDRIATLKAAREAEAELRGGLGQAEATTRALRDELKLAERAGRVLRARDEAERIGELLKQVREHGDSAAAARARIAKNPVTSEALSALEDAVAEVARLRGLVAASSVRMHVDYFGDTRLRLDGRELASGAPIVLEDGAQVDVPGIATLRFELPETVDEDIEIAFAEALAAEAEAFARCDARTLADARQRARQRADDAAAVKLAEGMLRSLAPQGGEALEQALADARETIKDASEVDVRPVEQIAQDLEAAEIREADLRGRLHSATETVADARETAAAAEMALSSARDQQARAEAQAGAPDGRAANGRELSLKAEAAASEAQSKELALAELKAEAPDAATAVANLKRAEAASENARKRREQLVERRADLSARIDTRADEGVEERRDEVSERLRSAQARAGRYEAEVAALVCLRDALEKARDGAREAYFEPVQEELRPLLRILHEDAGIDWETDSITPGALRRGGETEAFETLSGGTQEQIAILTRLAFARLFARRGQHLPIILDDALVYSDDDRIVKMFTALNRVAMDQQIIVFSCRQLAFAGLGGDRPAINVAAAH